MRILAEAGIDVVAEVVPWDTTELLLKADGVLQDAGDCVESMLSEQSSEHYSKMLRRAISHAEFATKILKKIQRGETP
jgi:hypothetical protein